MRDPRRIHGADPGCSSRKVLPVILSRLNPFRGLANPREVWVWGMYDLANHSFAVLINTVFFALYFTGRLAPNPEAGKLWWGVAVAASNGMVVLATPLLGAMADVKGARRLGLVASCLACVAMTCSLCFVTPSTPAAMGLYIGAAFAYAAGASFLGSFLPQISTAATAGRVSGIGWAMGYLSTCAILPATLLITGTKDFSDATLRRVFLFAGVWFLVMATPTLLLLKDRVGAAPGAAGKPLLREAIGRLRHTLRDAGGQRHAVRFLLVFLVYSCGMKVVVYFSSVIAKSRFGFDDFRLTLLMLVIAVSAGVGAFVVGVIQDRVGHRRAIIGLLALWTVASVIAAAMPKTPGWTWLFWVVGNLVGVGLGGAGSASRALVGVLSPRAKSAEFFGLWGLASCGAATIGPLAFGITGDLLGETAAMWMVVGFFVAGIAGMATVDVRAGIAAAREADG